MFFSKKFLNSTIFYEKGIELKIDEENKQVEVFLNPEEVSKAELVGRIPDPHMGRPGCLPIFVEGNLFYAKTDCSKELV